MARLWQLAPAFVVAFGAFWVTLGGFWAAWRQSSFNADLQQKNEEIARLQQENNGSITGGDSFCYTVFQIVGTSGESVNANSMPDDFLVIPNFVHNGKYPLYDVSARLVDIDELKDTFNPGRTIAVGNLTPGFAAVTPIRLPHHGKNLNFNIFYVGRNGSWTQVLRMRWVGNGWATANKVLGGGASRKELLQEVSANYPRGADGEVEWDAKP
ncbi:MAG: hypothetical protein WAU78_17185 [Roseiarcus sp.]